MRVYAYYRYSHLDQGSGTSIKRQAEDCARYAAGKGWTIHETLVDRGKSAFHGANRGRGASLWQFEADAAAGLHRDDILLIERIDRLSRQGFDAVRDLIRLLNGYGVTLAVAAGDEVYRPNEPLDLQRLTMLVLKTELAREESAQKSDRLKRKYAIRREEAQQSGQVMTRNMPAWLRKGGDGKAEIIDGRDVVIRRIFDLADEGMGKLRIVRALNAEFEPWSGLNGATSRFWSQSRVSRILADRQVTGEYQPRVKVAGKSVPEGEPWRDYWPRIISQEQFERVNAAAAVRQSPVNKRSTTVANLFGGLLRCYHCDGPMMFERRRIAGQTYHRGRYTLKHDESRLRCSAAWYDRDSDKPRCGNSATISYLGFERAMLDAALKYALDDKSFAQTDDLARLGATLSETKRSHEVELTKAQSFWSAWASEQSPALYALAQAADKRVAELASMVTDLEREVGKAAGRVDAEGHLSRIAEVRELLYSDDLDVREINRTKVSQGMRTVIEHIKCRDDRSALVRFIAGKRGVHIRSGKVQSDFNFDKPWVDLDGHEPAERMKIEAYRRRVAEQG